MKLNELRLGNWIDNGEGCYYIIDRCFFIDLLDMGHLLDEETGLKPIPLTEEWLLKFGFKRWKNKKIWTFKGVMIYQMADGCFYYGKKSTRIKIEALHQLQNLYHALTGEELTLK